MPIRMTDDPVDPNQQDDDGGGGGITFAALHQFGVDAELAELHQHPIAHVVIADAADGLDFQAVLCRDN